MMKTQFKKFENSQTFDNKVVLSSLLLFAFILIIAPINGKWSGYSNSAVALTGDLNEHKHWNKQTALFIGNENNDRENISLTYMIPFEAELETYESGGLETNKLNASYHENNRVLVQIEDHNLLITMLTQENEPGLEIEPWMTDQSFWKHSAQQENEFEEFSADMFASTKSETDEMTELIRKTKSYAKVEVDAPLNVEDWMLCESFWCTNKKTNNTYNESFALNEEK